VVVFLEGGFSIIEDGWILSVTLLENVLEVPLRRYFVASSFPLFDRLEDTTIFQGNLKRTRYFEGWYFKQADRRSGVAISIIPGVSLTEGDRHAFIQVLDGVTGRAYYQRYPIEKFEPYIEPFRLRIGESEFSLSGVTVKIRDLGIEGSFSYSKLHILKPKFGSRGIMGWYGYVPFMQTYHGLVSLDHCVSGSLSLQGEERVFNGARGYIEKDWGSSFPSSWVWLQSNCFDEEGVSLMVSIAVIPWLWSSFIGHIAIFLHKGVVYNLSTYDGGKISSFLISNGVVNFIVESKNYILKIRAEGGNFAHLKSPIAGVMEGRTSESLQGVVEAVFVNKSNNETIFSGLSKCSGLELMDVRGELEKKL